MKSVNRPAMKWSALSIALTAVLALLVAIGSPRALAQLAGTGNIQGTVSDPSGALIQNANVTLTAQSTGVIHSTTSSSGGLFSFPNLPIGAYNLSIEASGFAKYIRSNIILDVGSNISVKVKLQVGAASQEVHVKAEGLALQTQDVSFKQTISRREIHELPLNGRQMTSLVTLAGAAAPTPGNDINTSKNFFSSVTISVAGGQGNMTDYRLDGGDNNDYMTNVNLPFPFPDAVSQFSVESTALSAQNGLHPGGQVNVVTLSGTNQFHGTAFEFIRNNVINANNFFSTSPDQLHQNQFGGTVGGPILHNRLFFFAGYQRLVSNQQQSSSQAYVPTAENLAGDFSLTDGAGCTAQKVDYQLLNPLTGDPLPNNQIDPSYLSPTAIAMVGYLPKTNDPCGIVHYSMPKNQRENQFVTRIDATISPRQNIYGRYFFDGYNLPAFFSPTNVLLTGNPGNQERAQSLTLGHNFIFNAQTVNSFHITATRRRINRGPTSDVFNPSTFGIDMYVPTPNYFNLSVHNKWSLYCGTCNPGFFNSNTFGLSDDVNLVRGKHQIVLGGEFARSQFNTNAVYHANGIFDFTGNFSKAGPDGTSPGGSGQDSNLDFLTGALGEFQQSKPQQVALRAPITNLYLQDTWQASPKLTLTAGVRWEPLFFPHDYFNRGASFNHDDFLNDVHSSVFPNAPAGALFYGDKGIPKNFTQNSTWQFSPRLGATYNPDGAGKMVFRAGFAIMYDEPNFYTGQRVAQNPPYSTNVDNLPTTTPLSFDHPWAVGSAPGNVFPLPFNPPADSVFPGSGQYIVLPSHFHPPYVMQYTVSVQRQLAHSWMGQLNFIGNKTTHDAVGLPLSPAVYIPGQSTTGNTSSRFLLTLQNPTEGPKYAGGSSSILISDAATATYNGMVASIQHRAANFSFLANYTWSHCINIADAQGDISSVVIEDYNDLSRDRGSCGYDYRHMFNASFISTSNFNSLHGFAGALVNHWELGTILRLTSGQPFNVKTGFDHSLTGLGNDRPNLTGSAVYTNQQIYSKSPGNRNFINSSAFAANADGTFGNVGRNVFSGPKFANVNASVSRFFPVSEGTKLVLRIEAFNLFNHPNLSTPSSNWSSGSFGQISSTVSDGSMGDGGQRIFQGAVKFLF